MPGRLDPPPIVPPPAPIHPPSPPRPPYFAIGGTILALVAVAAVIWWFARARDARDVDDAEPDTNATIDVPKSLGPAVPLSRLNRLFQAASDGDVNDMDLELRLNKEGDRPTYVVKDPVELTFLSQDDGRCAVFHRDARGRIQLMHPSDDSTSVRAGEAQTVDGWSASEPVGAESLLLVCLPTDAKTTLADALSRQRTDWARALSAKRQDFEVRRGQ